MKKILALSIFALVIITAAVLVTAPFTTSASASSSVAVPKPTPSKTKTKIRNVVFIDGEFDGYQLKKTDAEWKSEMSPGEFYIMREEGTEQPYSGALTKNKKAGTYHCAACGLVLFKSDAKYDSQTGWPSFFQVAFKKNVIKTEDRSLGEVRIEVECARCRSHLGHVFNDGPRPTGLRYCINSVSLRFKESQ